MPERNAGGLDAGPESMGAPNYGLAGHFNFRFSILDLRLSMLCNESLTSV